MGTILESTPRKENFLFRDVKAYNVLFPVFRPKAISVSIRAKPNVTASIR